LGEERTWCERFAMSAIGPKRTSLVARTGLLSGKVDIACCENPLSWSLLGLLGHPYASAASICLKIYVKLALSSVP
jgi:hypothetical protein